LQGWKTQKINNNFFSSLSNLKKHEFNFIQYEKAQETWISLLPKLQKLKIADFIFMNLSQNSKNISVFIRNLEKHEFDFFEIKKLNIYGFHFLQAWKATKNWIWFFTSLKKLKKNSILLWVLKRSKNMTLFACTLYRSSVNEVGPPHNYIGGGYTPTAYFLIKVSTYIHTLSSPLFQTHESRLKQNEILFHPLLILKAPLSKEIFNLNKKLTNLLCKRKDHKIAYIAGVRWQLSNSTAVKVDSCQRN